jgi:DNA topoisomerase III
MRLYIAEKPSLGRAIAEVLPKPHEKGEGYIRAANGDVVSWCIGHLLEQAAPEAYNPTFKSWQWQTLPIIPDSWQVKPRSTSRKQLNILKQWVKQADELVHAGDPDREGQLLVDEVVDYLAVPKAKREQMLRCLISDLNPPAVRRALDALRSNREFLSLSTSALARSRADWLYGINMTRAYTLLARDSGSQALLSVGRVQTPILGLVVRRDAEIEAFNSKPFYSVLAHLVTPAGARFSAEWQPSEACLPWQDDEGRVLSRPLADNVVARIHDQPASVLEYQSKMVSQAAPLPYNLSALQIDAAKQLSLSPKQTLDVCQQLYERHKLITYPRSDCRYLPKEHHLQASEVAAAIPSVQPQLESAVEGANLQLRSAAWNDAKVSAHHAIIPTARRGRADGLRGDELRVYTLIARQYLLQFYPPLQRRETRISLDIVGGRFLATGREILAPGWRALLPHERGDGEPESRLPVVRQGDVLHCERGERLDKQTQAPKPFTDATLLAAMTGIARYVQDVSLRQILRETDGLGTEATRAGILDLLFQRSFLQHQGKSIRATETGKALIRALPMTASWPDMTARWEHALSAIEQRELPYQGFMQPLQQELARLVSEARSSKESLRDVLAAIPATAVRGGRPHTTAARKGGARVGARSGRQPVGKPASSTAEAERATPTARRRKPRVATPKS